ncbi:MAG: hypothetical protein DRJ46_03090 [Thermoprotei archaeon]|nr:MAG: hypothetical protein DRJ46_03090 [Thermoprotei archaeon]
MKRKQAKKILKEALEYYNINQIPLEKLEKYLVEKKGFTKEQAKNFWIEAYTSGIAEIGAIATDDLSRLINVIRLKRKEEYEEIG